MRTIAPRAKSSPEFAAIAKAAIAGVKRSAALLGSGGDLSDLGDRRVGDGDPQQPAAGRQVLCFETGQFATLWQAMAKKHGLEVEFIPGDWRHGVDPASLEARLTADRGHAIKAVMVVHNETSTGVASRIPELRRAIDAARHPALFFVDAISSAGAMDVRHDEWGIDITVLACRKG